MITLYISHGDISKVFMSQRGGYLVLFGEISRLADLGTGKRGWKLGNKCRVNVRVEQT